MVGGGMNFPFLSPFISCFLTLLLCSFSTGFSDFSWVRMRKRYVIENIIADWCSFELTHIGVLSGLIRCSTWCYCMFCMKTLLIQNLFSCEDVNCLLGLTICFIASYLLSDHTFYKCSKYHNGQTNILWLISGFLLNHTMYILWALRLYL